MWQKFAARSPFLQAFTGGKSQPKVATPTTGLVEALSGLSRKKSLVFVISDFLSLSEAEKEALRDAALVHDVVCVIVQDERERELPPGRGMYTLRDIVTGKTRNFWLNDANRRRFRENAQAKLDELTSFFQDADCDWQVFSTEQEADQVIPQMMLLFGGHRR